MDTGTIPGSSARGVTPTATPADHDPVLARILNSYLDWAAPEHEGERTINHGRLWGSFLAYLTLTSLALYGGACSSVNSYQRTFNRPAIREEYVSRVDEIELYDIGGSTGGVAKVRMHDQAGNSNTAWLTVTHEEAAYLAELQQKLDEGEDVHVRADPRQKDRTPFWREVANLLDPRGNEDNFRGNPFQQIERIEPDRVQEWIQQYR